MFEQLRENTTAKLTGAVLAAGLALGLAGCAQEQDPGTPNPTQSTETPVDVFDVDGQVGQIRKDLTTTHDGTIAGFAATVYANEDKMNATFDTNEAFNAITVSVGGQNVTCGEAVNYSGLGYKKAVTEGTVDDDNYWTCKVSDQGSLGIFVPYADKIEKLANSSDMPEGISPVVAVGIIAGTADQLLTFNTNPHSTPTREGAISAIEASVNTAFEEPNIWGGTMPTREDIGRIFDKAMVEVFEIDTEIIAEGDAPEPTPTDTETVPTTPENPGGALLPLDQMLVDYGSTIANPALTVSLPTPSGEMAVDYTCETFFGTPCSDESLKAFAVAGTYGDILSAFVPDVPRNVAFVTVFNLLQQETDPYNISKGGLATYDAELFKIDVRNLTNYDLSDQEVATLTSTLGVTLAAN